MEIPEHKRIPFSTSYSWSEIEQLGDRCVTAVTTLCKRASEFNPLWFGALASYDTPFGYYGALPDINDTGTVRGLLSLIGRKYRFASETYTKSGATIIHIGDESIVSGDGTPARDICCRLLEIIDSAEPAPRRFSDNIPVDQPGQQLTRGGQ